MFRLPGILQAAAILLLSAALFGDSFLTSTEFYRAYLDIAVVEKAGKTQNLDMETLAYLDDRNVPFDAKLAVVNALGWEFGKSTGNPQQYEKFLRAKYDLMPRTDLTVYRDRLSAEELSLYVYLTALDNYLDNETLIGLAPLIRTSVDKAPDSYGVNLVHLLVSAQLMQHSRGGWATNAPGLLQELEARKDLTEPLRPEAKRIIADYINLYLPRSER